MSSAVGSLLPGLLAIVGAQGRAPAVPAIGDLDGVDEAWLLGAASLLEHTAYSPRVNDGRRPPKDFKGVDDPQPAGLGAQVWAGLQETHKACCSR